MKSNHKTYISLRTDANNGVDEIVEEQRPFAVKHQVSFGDLCVPDAAKLFLN